MTKSRPALQTRCVESACRPFILHAAARRRRRLRDRVYGAMCAGRRLVQHRVEGIEVRRLLGSQIDLREVRVRGKKARDDGLVFFRLARAGRVNKTAARPYGIRGVANHLQLRGRERREIGLGSPPSNVGISPHRAEARAWRVHEHHIELRRERQPRLEIGLQHADVLRAAGARRFREAVARARCARRSRRSRRDRRPSPPSRWSCRLATRRYRALSFPVPARQAARRAAMLRPGEKTAQCRRAVFAAGCRTSRSVHREHSAQARPSRHAPARASTSASRVGLQPVHANRERRRGVVELSPMLRRRRIHIGRASDWRASPDETMRLPDRRADRLRAVAAAAAACASFARARAAPR